MLVVSFGGPEAPEDVRPFLERDPRPRRAGRATGRGGRPLPSFGGRSPINDQVRALLAAAATPSSTAGPRTTCRIYWGNRNWDPLLADTLRRMAEDGVGHGVRLRDLGLQLLLRAAASTGRTSNGPAIAVGAAAPTIDKLRVYFDHPGFIEPMADRVRVALRSRAARPVDAARRAAAPLGPGPRPPAVLRPLDPAVLAATCDYEAQLRAAAELVAAGRRRRRLGAGVAEPQRPAAGAVAGAGRGRPAARARRRRRFDLVVLVPLGFVSDHIEVLLRPRHGGPAAGPRSSASTPCGRPPWAPIPGSWPWSSSCSRSARQVLAATSRPGCPTCCPTAVAGVLARTRCRRRRLGAAAGAAGAASPADGWRSAADRSGGGQIAAGSGVDRLAQHRRRSGRSRPR